MMIFFPTSIANKGVSLVMRQELLAIRGYRPRLGEEEHPANQVADERQPPAVPQEKLSSIIENRLPRRLHN